MTYITSHTSMAAFYKTQYHTNIITIFYGHGKTLIQGATPKTPAVTITKKSALRILRKYKVEISIAWSYWSGWKKGVAMQPTTPAN